MKFTFLISFVCLFALNSCTVNPNPDVSLPSVAIGTQTWTTSNLDVAKYKNGDAIPQITDPIQWANLTTGAWCYPQNDAANGAIYGKLYNWYAINDPRGLAPQGWHVPTVAEWTTLSTFLGGDLVSGGKLKEAGTTHWSAPNTDATNETGFGALPANVRVGNGSFNPLGYETYWWATGQLDDITGFTRSVVYQVGGCTPGYYTKNTGLSVRLLKN